MILKSRPCFLTSSLKNSGATPVSWITCAYHDRVVSRVEHSFVDGFVFRVNVLLAEGEEDVVEDEVYQEDDSLDDVFSPHSVVCGSMYRRPV
jgi:hypothetical protein